MTTSEEGERKIHRSLCHERHHERDGVHRLEHPSGGDVTIQEMRDLLSQHRAQHDREWRSDDDATFFSMVSCAIDEIETARGKALEVSHDRKPQFRRRK